MGLDLDPSMAAHAPIIRVCRPGFREWHETLDTSLKDELSHIQVHTISVRDEVRGRLIGNYVKTLETFSPKHTIVHTNLQAFRDDLEVNASKLLSVSKKRLDLIGNCRILVLVLTDAGPESTFQSSLLIQQWLGIFKCNHIKILAFCREPLIFPQHMATRRWFFEMEDVNEIKIVRPLIESRDGSTLPPSMTAWQRTILDQISPFGPKVMMINGRTKTIFGIDAFIRDLQTAIPSSLIVYRDHAEMENDLRCKEPHTWKHVSEEVKLFCCIFRSQKECVRSHRKVRLLLRQFTKIIHRHSQILILGVGFSAMSTLMPATSYLLWEWTHDRGATDIALHGLAEGVSTEDVSSADESVEEKEDSHASDMSTDIESEDDFFGVSV